MLKRYIPLCLLSLILLAIPLAFHIYQETSDVVGILTIDPEAGNELMIGEYDLRLTGIDKDGVTYFCLPAYARLTKLDLSLSPVGVFLIDGSPLSDPGLGEIRDVLVAAGDREIVPWKICFMRSENIPSVFLSFDEGGIEDIEHDLYKEVSVKVISSSGRSILEDSESLIKGRGNATWDLGGFSPDKKPYELKFTGKHSLGTIPPLGKWTLLANAYEGTGILNKMIFDTAREMGMPYVTSSEWVDLYADGRYLGNYLVCSEPQVSAAHVTEAGGYLIEKNDVYFEKKKYGFTTEHDSFTIKAPEYVSDAELTEIKDFTSFVDNAIYGGGTGQTVGIDMDSFVRWFLLEEYFFNDDALISSCFFYTDPELSTLYAGPPWDFDGTCGDDYGRYVDYTQSILDTPKDRKPLGWYGILYDNDEFRESLRDTFTAMLPRLRKLIDSGIDGYYRTVHASMDMNRAIYGRAGYGPNFTVPGYYDTVYNNIRYTKFFLYNRLKYLSEAYLGEDKVPHMDFDDGSVHTLLFSYPDGRQTELSVPDGSRPDIASFPGYDEESFEGWVYEANDLSPSYFIPVYEDTAFVLKDKDSADDSKHKR